MKPALLVIDIQKAFYKDSPDASRSLDGAIEYINAAIALFREKKLPVISVQHEDHSSNVVPGTEGFDLPESLNILPSDPHYVKTYGNAFNKTKLAEDLRKQGVDTVIVTGYCAEYCIMSTYRGAMDVDLTPIIMRGSIASSTPKNIRFVESVNELISYGALRKMLE
jgi:nicotinamidase-related amidase